MPRFTNGLYHVTCFAKVSLLLLKSCDIKVIIKLTRQVRCCYHSFLVEIIVGSVNLIQMSKQKIFITIMENN